MADPDNRPYRPNVGVALFNAQGLVLIGRRVLRFTPGGDGAHEWQMPQGGIDEGEDARAAALRELYEETNVSSVSFLAEAPGWFAYDLPESIASTRWKGRYRGQKQKWFAFRFEGEEREIDVARPAGGAHEAEFDVWRWERLDALPAMVIPFKRPVYESVAAAFAGIGPA